MSSIAFAADIDPLIQTPAVHEVTITQPDLILEDGAEEIQKTYSSACNCYNILKERFSDVPTMSEIERKAGPGFGNVAFMRYPPTNEFPNGVPHVALVKQFTPTGIEIEEYNFESCVHSSRVIPYNYHRLVGFVTI